MVRMSDTKTPMTFEEWDTNVRPGLPRYRDAGRSDRRAAWEAGGAAKVAELLEGAEVSEEHGEFLAECRRLSEMATTEFLQATQGEVSTIVMLYRILDTSLAEAAALRKRLGEVEAALGEYISPEAWKAHKAFHDLACDERDLARKDAAWLRERLAEVERERDRYRAALDVSNAEAKRFFEPGPVPDGMADLRPNIFTRQRIESIVLQGQLDRLRSHFNIPDGREVDQWFIDEFPVDVDYFPEPINCGTFGPHHQEIAEKIAALTAELDAAKEKAALTEAGFVQAEIRNGAAALGDIQNLEAEIQQLQARVVELEEQKLDMKHGIEVVRRERDRIRDLVAASGVYETSPDVPDVQEVRRVARELGYAIGVHGTLKRDCDLIAVPWTENAAPPKDLVDELCTELDARVVGYKEDKPHGRVAWIIQVNGWAKAIDLSIVRPLPGIDELANIIRDADGGHKLGAGALAEAILERWRQE